MAEECGSLHGRRRTPDNIFRRATDIKAGQVVLRKGGRINPQHVAVLASVGCVQPLVAKRPRVGVLASGDELVPPAARPGPSQIRNSNGSQLVAQLAALGLKARDYGIVKDVASDIDACSRRALAENDVRDRLRRRVGGRFRPGAGSSASKWCEAAVREDRGQARQAHRVRCLWAGVLASDCPGNPVSTFVVFELLVKPFLYKLMGHDYSPVYVQMRLDDTITRKDTDRQSWIPVRITSEETVKPVQYHGSAHLSAICEAGGLIADGNRRGEHRAGNAGASPVALRR